MNYVPPTHHQFSRMPGHVPRVVITGLGAVSAAGVGAKELWKALLEGRSGIGPITHFDASDLASRIAGEVRGFDPFKLIDARLKPKRLSRQSQFAVVAAAEATRDARLAASPPRRGRVGVVIGSSLSSLNIVAESAIAVHTTGPRYAAGTSLAMCNSQAAAIAITDLLGYPDVSAMAVSGGCASGVDAVRVGCDMIRAGHFDTVICGGVDAPLSRTPMADFIMLGLNSTRNNEPQRASRPFDRERDSGTLAEGAGIVVLENHETARDRGRAPYAEIIGVHSAMDQDRTTMAVGLEAAMRGALSHANCPIEEIDYISAWGVGHPVIDRNETLAIKKVFGSHAHQIAVGSIKGVTGIPLAASGGLQLVALALSYREGLLPPTLNCEHSDLDCDLDYVTGKARRIRLRRTLLNAHGMGGSNTCMVLSQPSA